jgi:hypothetical protein
MRARTRAGLINAGLTIILLAAGAASTGPAQARTRPAARVTPAVVLVNQPAARVCTGHTFKVGVWYQRSGGSPAYRVAVYNPRGRRIFYRHGAASSARWKFWRIRAWRAGTFRTVYSGHWNPGKPSSWVKYRARTRSRRC